MLRSPSVWFLCLMYGRCGPAGNFVFSLLTVYLIDDRHLPPRTTKWLHALPSPAAPSPVRRRLGVGLAHPPQGQPQVGPGVNGVAGLALAGVAFAATVARGRLAPWPALMRGQFGNNFCMGPAWAACADIGERHAGTLSRPMNMTSNFTGAVGAAVSGSLLPTAKGLVFMVFGGNGARRPLLAGDRRDQTRRRGSVGLRPNGRAMIETAEPATTKCDPTARALPQVAVPDLRAHRLCRVHRGVRGVARPGGGGRRWYLGVAGRACPCAGVGSLLGGWLATGSTAGPFFSPGPSPSPEHRRLRPGRSQRPWFLPGYWLLGIGLGFLYPPLIGWLNQGEDAHANRRGVSRTLILFCVAWNLGMMCGQLAGGWLFALGPRWTYGTAFAAAVANVVLAVVAAARRVIPLAAAPDA